MSSPAAGDAVETQAVTCPGGTVAGTYTVDGVSAADPPKGDDLIRSDRGGWLYRTGTDSVVVVRDGQRLRLAVTSSY